MNSLDRARDFGMLNAILYIVVIILARMWIFCMKCIYCLWNIGLDNLCEFIEDCEYPSLSVRILNLIGQLGTKFSVWISAYSTIISSWNFNICVCCFFFLFVFVCWFLFHVEQHLHQDTFVLFTIECYLNYQVSVQEQ